MLNFYSLNLLFHYDRKNLLCHTLEPVAYEISEENNVMLNLFCSRVTSIAKAWLIMGAFLALALLGLIFI